MRLRLPTTDRITSLAILLLAIAYMRLEVASAGDSPPTATIYYTFLATEAGSEGADEDSPGLSASGGVAMMRIDRKDGSIAEHRVLVEHSFLRRAEKLGIDDEQRRLLVLSRLERGVNAMILALDDTTSEPVMLSLPGSPDDLSIFGHRALVGTEDGSLVMIDLHEGRVTDTWSVRRGLTPPGHKPEDVEILPCGTLALVSLQKDNRSGTRMGNRVLVMRVPELELLADLPLPRDRPELHHLAAGNELGPGPEIIHFCTANDIVIVSLDLYGALATFDLSAALQGRLENYIAHSAATDGSYGNSFVDRLGRFTHDGRPHILAANAGAEGGAVVLDLTERRISQRLDVSHGLETLTYLPGRRMIVASAAGKHKERGEPRVIKTRRPRAELWTFTITDSSEGEPLRAAHHSMPENTFRIVPVDAKESGLLFITSGPGAFPDYVTIYDIDRGTVTARTKAHGRTRRTIGPY